MHLRLRAVGVDDKGRVWIIQWTCGQSFNYLQSFKLLFFFTGENFTFGCVAKCWQGFKSGNHRINQPLFLEKPKKIWPCTIQILNECFTTSFEWGLNDGGGGQKNNPISFEQLISAVSEDLQTNSWRTRITHKLEYHILISLFLKHACTTWNTTHSPPFTSKILVFKGASGLCIYWNSNGIDKHITVRSELLRFFKIQNIR